MNKTAFLLYRPAVDYDDQMYPYFVVQSKSKATKILKEIRTWGQEIVEKFPEEIFENEFVDYSDGYGVIDKDKYYEACEKRDEKIKEILVAAALTIPEPFKDFKDSLIDELRWHQTIYVEKQTIVLI